MTLTSEFLQTFLTEDVEALEEFGGGVGVEADWTGQLVGQLLEGLIGNTWTLRHFPTGDKTHPVLALFVRFFDKYYLYVVTVPKPRIEFRLIIVTIQNCTMKMPMGAYNSRAKNRGPALTQNNTVKNKFCLTLGD